MLPKALEGENTSKEQHDSPRSSNYRVLLEEKGIANKLFKDTAEINKKLLENEEESLIRSRKAHHRSSLSENSANHRRHSSEELDFSSLSICDMALNEPVTHSDIVSKGQKPCFLEKPTVELKPNGAEALQVIPIQ